jgi:hypothetical protein
LFEWSASALFIEEDIAWIGLVNYPEGAENAGGLLRYDTRSGRAQMYMVDDVILGVTRWETSLYLDTTNGIYVLDNERFTRYRFEPDFDGAFQVIKETVN